MCTVEKISEHYLIPVLEQLLDTFPFVIKGFHSDNGSEYINKQVAKLLEKLLIELLNHVPDTPMIMLCQKENRGVAIFAKAFMGIPAQRIRIDCVSKANHNLSLFVRHLW